MSKPNPILHVFISGARKRGAPDRVEFRTCISSLEDGGKYGKTLVELSGDQRQLITRMIEKMRPMDPAFFARKALDCVAKNKAVIVLPKSYHIFR